MKATIAVLLCLSASADAFTSPSVFAAVNTISSSSSTRGSASAVFAQQQEESNRLEEFDFSKMAVSTASIWAASASMASADSPDWGIFEGKTLSRKSPLFPRNNKHKTNYDSFVMTVISALEKGFVFHFCMYCHSPPESIHTMLCAHILFFIFQSCTPL